LEQPLTPNATDAATTTYHEVETRKRIGNAGPGNERTPWRRVVSMSGNVRAEYKDSQLAPGGHTRAVACAFPDGHRRYGIR